jgi:hypothetical protein
MRSAVVLDKNFLQGANRARVLALAESHELLMPAALFHELLTTDPDARRKCFAKLPQTENPVVLVDHVGRLISHEIEMGLPSGRPSTHRMDIRFRFHPRLVESDYELPDEAQAAVREQIEEVQGDIQRLIDLSETIPVLFPGLLSGSTEAQAAAKADAEASVGDLEDILAFYNNMEPAQMTPAGPQIHGALEQWAHLRWLQVLMLFAIDLHVRYRGRLRKELSSGVMERLEHDVHDGQILALGALEGAIATQEKKLLRWWPILCPNGQAYGTAA